MTENMNELKNSITKLKLLKDKTTDEQQKIELEGAIELLNKEYSKIDAPQEKKSFKSLTKKMHATNKEVTAFHKELQGELDDIEKLLQYPERIKKIIERIGNTFGVSLSS